MTIYIYYNGAEDKDAADRIGQKMGGIVEQRTGLPRDKLRDRDVVFVVGGQAVQPIINEIQFQFLFVNDLPGENRVAYFQTTDGGIKKRTPDTAESYFRNWWADYAPGFGDLDRNAVNNTGWNITPVDESEANKIRIRKILRFYIYGYSGTARKKITLFYVAGWTATDTLAAAKYIEDKWSSYRSGNNVSLSRNTVLGAKYYPSGVEPEPEPENPVHNGKVIEVYYKNMSPFMATLSGIGNKFQGGGVQAMINHKEELIEKLNNVMPQGWKLNTLTFHDEYTELEFEETGSLLLIAAIVVGVIMVFSLLWGLIVTKWKSYNVKIQEQITIQKEKDIVLEKQDNDIVQALVDEGIVTTTDEATLIIDKLREEPPPVEKPEGVLGELKDIILYAVGAVIIIMLIQQMGNQAAR